MYLFEQYGIDIGYVVIGLAGVVLLLLIMIIVMMVRNHLLRKKYKQFMEGENGRSLEKAFSDKFEAIDQLQDDVKNINGHIIKITKQLTTAYQKIGLVKYDAFKEIGGKLSFVLVLLTEDNNGFYYKLDAQYKRWMLYVCKRSCKWRGICDFVRGRTASFRGGKSK